MHFVVSFNVTICIFLMYFVNRGFVDCAYFDLRYTFPANQIPNRTHVLGSGFFFNAFPFSAAEHRPAKVFVGHNTVEIYQYL